MCISDAIRTLLSLQENICVFSSYIRIFKCWGVFWMTSWDVFRYLLDLSVVRSQEALACWKLVAITKHDSEKFCPCFHTYLKSSSMKMQNEWFGPYILEQKHCNLLCLFWRRNQAQRTGPRPEEINAIQHKVRTSKNEPKVIALCQTEMETMKVMPSLLLMWFSPVLFSSSGVWVEKKRGMVDWSKVGVLPVCMAGGQGKEGVKGADERERWS